MRFNKLGFRSLFNLMCCAVALLAGVEGWAQQPKQFYKFKAITTAYPMEVNDVEGKIFQNDGDKLAFTCDIKYSNLETNNLNHNVTFIAIIYRDGENLQPDPQHTHILQQTETVRPQTSVRIQLKPVRFAEQNVNLYRTLCIVKVTSFPYFNKTDTVSGSGGDFTRLVPAPINGDGSVGDP